MGWVGLSYGSHLGAHKESWWSDFWRLVVVSYALARLAVAPLFASQLPIGRKRRSSFRGLGFSAAAVKDLKTILKQPRVHDPVHQLHIFAVERLITVSNYCSVVFVITSDYGIYMSCYMSASRLL